MTDATAAFLDRADAFLACHQRRLNVELHLLTTPVGLYATLVGLGLVSPVLPAVVGLVHVVSLLGRIPRGLWLATALVTAGLVAAATWLPVGPWWALGLLVGAYALQEAAHHLAGEPTFQSTYQGRAGWLGELAVHTWELLPLVLLSAKRRDLPFLSSLVARDHVIHIELPADTDADRTLIRQWATDHLPTTEHTTHGWQHELPPAVHDAFERIAQHPSVLEAYRDNYGPLWDVEVVHDMNEIYVTGPEQELTSDTVFYMNHIDGPWTVFPGAALHRCMVACSPNARVRTHFPMTGVPSGDYRSQIIDDGQAVAFDFNRELHFITNEPQVCSTDLRINLKVHHVVFPKRLRPWGRLLAWLTSRYNERARQVFLDTIQPRSLAERAGAAFVVGTTKAFDLVQAFIGMGNLLYVIALAVVSAAVGSAVPFVAGVSFVHYLTYIATFSDRTNVSYGHFLRNVVFFKTVSMGTLAVLYLQAGVADPISLTLVALGFGLSALSARALGMQGTYFGVELGRLQPRTITAFPYGTIPHPMILGAIVGLLGVHALAPFREAWPWLVPTHIALYLVHMLQEHLDDRGAHEGRGDHLVDLAAK